MRTIALTSATACLLALSMAGMANAEDPAGEANQIADAINDVAPPVEGTARTTIEDTGDADGKLTAQSETLDAAIPAESTGEVQLDTAYASDDATLKVGLPSGASSEEAVLSDDGTVIYPETFAATDVAVQAFEDGISIQAVLSGPEAPGEFAYPVDLPDGGTITADEGGGVVVLDADGGLVGGFAPPWAKDAAGNDIPTHFEIQGTSVVQVVEHSSGTQYPVVADPWLWRDLIHSASWTKYPEGWTLKVTPTLWARGFAGSHLVGAAGWNELYSKYRNRGLNTNLDGMRDQYICHQEIVAIRSPRKATWNLDEWRPDYSYWQTVNSSCNPGGAKWFD
jgi:hypothetical protein